MVTMVEGPKNAKDDLLGRVWVPSVSCSELQGCCGGTMNCIIALYEFSFPLFFVA